MFVRLLFFDHASLWSAGGERVFVFGLWSTSCESRNSRARLHSTCRSGLSFLVWKKGHNSCETRNFLTRDSLSLCPARIDARSTLASDRMRSLKYWVRLQLSSRSCLKRIGSLGCKGGSESPSNMSNSAGTLGSCIVP